MGQRTERRVFINLAPLRRSRDLRYLVLGELVSMLFVFPGLAAGFAGLDDAGRSAIVPNLVHRSEVATANAIFQALSQFGLVAGPAVAGLLLAGAGVRFVYWMDVASFGAALLAVFLISPQPPGGAVGHRPGCARSSRASVSCARASGTWSPAWSRPPSATRCRWCPGPSVYRRRAGAGPAAARLLQAADARAFPATGTRHRYHQPGSE